MDREIIKQAAQSLREENSTVATVIDGIEKFIADEIKGGELRNIKIPLFGTFAVNQKRLHYLVNIKPMPKVKTLKPHK